MPPSRFGRITHSSNAVSGSPTAFSDSGDSYGRYSSPKYPRSFNSRSIAGPGVARLVVDDLSEGLGLELVAEGVQFGFQAVADFFGVFEENLNRQQALAGVIVHRLVFRLSWLCPFGPGAAVELFRHVIIQIGQRRPVYRTLRLVFQQFAYSCALGQECRIVQPPEVFAVLHARNDAMLGVACVIGHTRL